MRLFLQLHPHRNQAGPGFSAYLSVRQELKIIMVRVSTVNLLKFQYQDMVVGKIDQYVSSFHQILVFFKINK